MSLLSPFVLKIVVAIGAESPYIFYYSGNDVASCRLGRLTRPPKPYVYYDHHSEVFACDPVFDTRHNLEGTLDTMHYYTLCIRAYYGNFHSLRARDNCDLSTRDSSCNCQEGRHLFSKCGSQPLPTTVRTDYPNSVQVIVLECTTHRERRLLHPTTIVCILP
jgi:hypothetical protein